MHTSGNNEHQEHGLEYKKRCITQLLLVLNGLHIFDVYFQMHVMFKRRPRIFQFLHMKYFVIGLHRMRIWWEQFEGDRRRGNFYIVVYNVIRMSNLCD